MKSSGNHVSSFIPNISRIIAEIVLRLSEENAQSFFNDLGNIVEVAPDTYGSLMGLKFNQSKTFTIYGKLTKVPSKFWKFLAKEFGCDWNKLKEEIHFVMSIDLDRKESVLVFHDKESFGNRSEDLFNWKY